MTTITTLIATLVLLGASTAQADTATEKEIRELVVSGNEYVRENLQGEADTVAEEGSIEFWSSGGLLHHVPADADPQEFEVFTVRPKHITVVTLVPGKAAAAFYYSEGALKPKGAEAVSNYLTRVTEIYVKEDGKWKLRGAHWSPVQGGAGTTQTSVE
jgi:hypothetical protein